MSDYLFDFGGTIDPASFDLALDIPGVEYSEGGDDGEIIVVTATRAQVEAAHLAYSRAVNEMFALGAVGAGVLGRIGGAIGGILGYGVATVMDDGAAQQLTEDLAESYYLADGADGVYDGVSDADRAAPHNVSSW